MLATAPGHALQAQLTPPEPPSIGMGYKGATDMLRGGA